MNHQNPDDFDEFDPDAIETEDSPYANAQSNNDVLEIVTNRMGALDTDDVDGLLDEVKLLRTAVGANPPGVRNKILSTLKSAKWSVNAAEVDKILAGSAISEEQTDDEALAAERERQRQERIAYIEGAVPDLLNDPYPIKRIIRLVHRLGVANEEPVITATILAATTRSMEKPIHLLVTGASSSGKSFVVAQTLKLLPQAAVDKITDMSATAIFDTPNPIANTVLFLAEASLLQRDDKDNALQTAFRELMEDQLAKRIVRVPDPDGGWTSVEQCTEGPVCIVMTSTTVLEEELANRVISIPSDESVAQTKAIGARTAAAFQPLDRDPTIDHDVEEERLFHEYLQYGVNRVQIPFADLVSSLSNTNAVRYRRDLRHVLSLVCASALLHQRHRDIVDGHVIASIDDYAIARSVVEPALRADADATQNLKIIDLVHAVEELIDERRASTGAGSSFGQPVGVSIPLRDIGAKIGLQRSQTSARLREAVEAGVLTNSENRSRQPPCLSIGPKTLDDAGHWILPPVELVQAKMELDT